ncbi:MAG TPA: PEGA domain-containing protein [Gallionellaceae bacterium]|nr:PEGA domain-containing protein [Gallionellaceae bacterium]
MDLEVNVTMDGKFVPHAKIMMDGKLLGETGEDGQFNASMNQQPGKQVKIEAAADRAGFEVQPWNSEFTVKLPNEGEILKYVFDVELKALPFVALTVQEKGVPIAGATVKLNNQEVGKTDESGGFVYKYQPQNKNAAIFEVSKNGYSTWKKPAKLEPGNKLLVDIYRQVAVTFEALKDEYGRGVGIAGVDILIDGKKIGKTNDMGVLVHNYDNAQGKPAKVTYSAPGYLPSQWTSSMAIEVGTTVRHYFYPLSPKPIKVGIFHFGGNTPGVDLKDVAAQTQTAIRTQLFKHGVFSEVAGGTLDKEIKSANLNIAKLTSKGWQQTRLQGLLDMVVVGSVAKDDKGYLIEAKFHSSGGKLIYSQMIRADDRSDINSAAKDIASNVMERFPFEGTVVALKDDRYEINLGKPYAISRGTEFAVMPSANAKSSPSNAMLTVKKVGDGSSYAALEDGQAGVKIEVGARVVRLAQRDGESAGGSGGRESVVLSVKGGAGKDASALAGVNIYLNNDWVGATGSDGRVKVTIRTGKNYNLMLYRHGYQQVIEKLKVEKSGDSKNFVMAANYAVFKVDSTPSPATVYADGELLGKTPMLDGRQLALGFHTVRVTAGDSYRDWEEVVEFDKKIEDRTGAKKIVLYKDYMKLGEAAEEKGNVDAAIAAYAATVKGHPDYSDAHHRLAQLYLDEKDDYNGAIREFENVLSLPENEQLIFKQYAVAYTNLGHAYYEKGNHKMMENRNEAAQYYAKALQNLKMSKQNTRFFPAAEYDQAVHDTYFYLALSYQKLFMITNRSNMLSDANLAWRDYFDFFPKKLEGDPVFAEHRETAKKFWNQIKDK